MRVALGGAGAAVLGIVVGACSGAGGPAVPASCGTTEPCGGNVVGAWGPGGSCTNRASLQARYMSQLGGECPGGSSVSIPNATSNWAKVASTFNDDGSYVGTTTFSASVEILVPEACLVTRGCADLDAQLRAMVDPAAGIVAGSCLNAETACACLIVQQQPTTSQSGTYSVSGTTLTLTPLGGSPTDMPYCVRGSELHLVTPDTSGAASIASDIILVRQ